jgi:hypothetical protein
VLSSSTQPTPRRALWRSAPQNFIMLCQGVSVSDGWCRMFANLFDASFFYQTAEPTTAPTEGALYSNAVSRSEFN